jgi:hypothetical protein
VDDAVAGHDADLGRDDRHVELKDPAQGDHFMIRIFCDFWQFSAKKLVFFSKTNVMIENWRNLALFWVKNANFLQFFLQKYFKNHNIGPWWVCKKIAQDDAKPIICQNRFVTFCED